MSLSRRQVDGDPHGRVCVFCGVEVRSAMEVVGAGAAGQMIGAGLAVEFVVPVFALDGVVFSRAVESFALFRPGDVGHGRASLSERGCPQRSITGAALTPNAAARPTQARNDRDCLHLPGSHTSGLCGSWKLLKGAGGTWRSVAEACVARGID